MTSRTMRAPHKIRELKFQDTSDTSKFEIGLRTENSTINRKCKHLNTVNSIMNQTIHPRIFLIYSVSVT